MKRCCRCKEEKPLDQFGKRAAAPDGLQGACKECRNAKQRDYNERPEVKEREADRKQTPEYKEAAKGRSAKWRKDHPGCDSRAAMKWVADHPEQRAEWLANYKADPDNAAKMAEYQTNYDRTRRKKKPKTEADRKREAFNSAKRRALEQRATTVDFSPEELDARLAAWGDKCWICQIVIATGIDHVKPLSKGGAHMLCNFRPACGPCNSGKSNKWPWPTVLDYVHRRRIAVRRLHRLK